MSNNQRDAARRAFLAACDHGEADCVPLIPDASFRCYFRVASDGDTKILMDAPPPREDIEPFLAVTAHLRQLGLRAPFILHSDSEQGFILMEDLGTRTFTALLSDGEQESALYLKAIETICRLHQSVGATSIDLPGYDLEYFIREALLLTEWYLPAVTGSRLSDKSYENYNEAWKQVFEDLPAVHPTLVLRDFHVDNLLLVDGDCAVLDYQDALVGPAAYDLVSLLEDARRDISAGTVTASLESYFRCSGLENRSEFMHHYRVWGAQRHAKVLGIFVRLWLRDDKPVYLQHLPRVWRLMMNSLEFEALEPVKAWMQENGFGPDYQHPEQDRNSLLEKLGIQPSET